MYETVIHAFNPTTKMLYTFKIKYDVKRMSNLPNKHKINNMGENLYEKRLVQLYGGGNLGRYRLAIKNVNFFTLLNLLSPLINAQLKDDSSVEFSRTGNFKIQHPTNFEFKPSEDLIINVGLNSFMCNVYVSITYKGRRVNLLGEHSDNNITKEKIEEALKVAKQFDEICEIIRKAYNL